MDWINPLPLIVPRRQGHGEYFIVLTVKFPDSFGKNGRYRSKSRGHLATLLFCHKSFVPKDCLSHMATPAHPYAVLLCAANTLKANLVLVRTRPWRTTSGAFGEEQFGLLDAFFSKLSARAGSCLRLPRRRSAPAGTIGSMDLAIVHKLACIAPCDFYTHTAYYPGGCAIRQELSTGYSRRKREKGVRT
jgi:hypothetical protein